MEGATQHKQAMSDLFQQVAGGQVISLQAALAAAESDTPSSSPESSSHPVSPADVLDPAAIPPDSVKDAGDQLQGIHLGLLHIGGTIEEGRWHSGSGGRGAAASSMAQGGGTETAVDEAVLAAAAAQEAGRSHTGLLSRLSLFTHPSHSLQQPVLELPGVSSRGRQGGGLPQSWSGAAQQPPDGAPAQLRLIKGQAHMGSIASTGGRGAAHATPFAAMSNGTATIPSYGAAASQLAAHTGILSLGVGAERGLEGPGEDIEAQLRQHSGLQSIGERLRAWSLPLTQEWLVKRR
jgi:hypothetical protein